jgi:hypothetical protein
LIDWLIDWLFGLIGWLVGWFLHSFIRSSISIYLSIYLFIYYLFINLFVYLFIDWFIYLLSYLFNFFSRDPWFSILALRSSILNPGFPGKFKPTECFLDCIFPRILPWILCHVIIMMCLSDFWFHINPVKTSETGRNIRSKTIFHLGKKSRTTENVWFFLRMRGESFRDTTLNVNDLPRLTYKSLIGMQQPFISILGILENPRKGIIPLTYYH